MTTPATGKVDVMNALGVQKPYVAIREDSLQGRFVRLTVQTVLRVQKPFILTEVLCIEVCYVKVYLSH